MSLARRPAGHLSPSGHARQHASAWLWTALVMVLVVALDQLSKSAVRKSIIPGEEHSVLPGLELVNTRNQGVAFGLLPGHQEIVTFVIGAVLLVLLVYFRSYATKRLIWLPTGMLLGGALGNIIDRLRDGSVTDFIKLPLGWPPFNLADASITLGVLILVLVIDSERTRAKEQLGPQNPLVAVGRGSPSQESDRAADSSP